MINIFTRKIDRFDFRLVGKREVYMPYNNYKLMYQVRPENALGTNHVKPENLRWELHRAWTIEATVRPGKRHVFHNGERKPSSFYTPEPLALTGRTECVSP